MVSSDHNSGLGIGSNSAPNHLNVPTFSGFGQFSVNILSLGKQAHRSRFSTADMPRRAVCRAAPARAPSPRRCAAGACPTKSAMRSACTSDRRAANARRLAQERAFFPMLSTRWTCRPGCVRQRAGDDQPGKSSAGAEIDPDSCFWRQIQKLQRIGDVPGPNHRLGRGRDQIDALLPLQQERNKAVEARFCFT